MKTAIISLCAIGLSMCSSFALTNSQIKLELQKEITGLQVDLSAATAEVILLKRDKDILQTGLDNMEAWGNEQQAQAQAYWNETQTVRQELVAEKKITDDLLRKLHRAKYVLMFLAGFACLLLYFKFGQAALGTLSVASGPYGPLIQIAAPILAFGLGCLIVFIVF